MSQFDKTGPPAPMSALTPLITPQLLEAQNMMAQARANEAKWDEEAAIQRAAEASIDAQVSQQILLRQKNANRPSMYLGVELLRNDAGKWVAQFGELYVEGDSPEQACDNFDHVWLHGDGGREEGPAGQTVPTGDGDGGKGGQHG